MFHRIILKQKQKIWYFDFLNFFFFGLKSFAKNGKFEKQNWIRDTHLVSQLERRGWTRGRTCEIPRRLILIKIWTCERIPKLFTDDYLVIVLYITCTVLRGNKVFPLCGTPWSLFRNGSRRKSQAWKIFIQLRITFILIIVLYWGFMLDKTEKSEKFCIFVSISVIFFANNCTSWYYFTKKFWMYFFGIKFY